MSEKPTIDDFPKIKKYIEAAVARQGVIFDRIDIKVLPGDIIEVTALDNSGRQYGPVATTRDHALNGAWEWH